MKTFSGAILILLIVGILTLAFGIQTGTASTITVPDDYPATWISVVPSQVTIDTHGAPLPTALTTVNITVTNVTELFAWQVKIYYDPSVLSFDDQNAAVYPAANIGIFAGLEHWFFTFLGVDEGGSYLLVGSTLISEVLPDWTVVTPSVNGSGVLAQLNFKGISSGSSYLNFSSYGSPLDDTILLNVSEVGTYWRGYPIPARLANGFVTVVESPSTNLMGDINLDGKVDIRDIAQAAQAFGSYPGQSRWNMAADINQDGVVDIRDLVLIAKHYGET